MTLKEFVTKYQGKYVDKYGNIGYYVDWNGTNNYMGQCASLARAYLNLVLGYTQDSFGNAKDYVNFYDGKIVSTPQDGDLIVYPTCTEWGHIGVYYQGKVFNQNPYVASLDNLSAFGNYKIVRPNRLQVNKEIPKLKMNNVLWELGRLTLAGDRNAYDKIPTTQAQAQKPVALIQTGGVGEFNGLYMHADYKGVDALNRKVTFTKLTIEGKAYFIPIYNSDNIQRFVREKVKVDG